MRSLAGRVQDGLDKPGADNYIDHPLSALRAQPELSPYSYSATLVRAGTPRAGPPEPGHVVAHSFVPEEKLTALGGAGTTHAVRAAAAVAGEVAAAVAALTSASQDQITTQAGAPGAGTGADTGAGTANDGGADSRTAVLVATVVAAAEEVAAVTVALAAAAASSQDSIFTQEDDEQPGFSLLDPEQTPVIPAGGDGMSTNGDGARGEVKVSPPAPIVTDRNPAHCDVPIGAVNDCSKHTSPGTGPLGAGGTVGRTTGQLQTQVGAQTQGQGQGTPADRKRPRK